MRAKFADAFGAFGEIVRIDEVVERTTPAGLDLVRFAGAFCRGFTAIGCNPVAVVMVVVTLADGSGTYLTKFAGLAACAAMRFA